MKNKTPLVLMEQLVMVLVFALAAALCLRAFALSDQISRENERRSQAAHVAQNAAETLKACGGDFAQAAALLGGGETADGWSVCYDEAWTVTADSASCAYRLKLREENSPVPGLGQAQVRVVRADAGEEPLFALTVAWQEVL